MEPKVARDVRILKLYAVAATIVCVGAVAAGPALQSRKQKFEEIDVERINIVEKDGKLKMVIANQERQHPGIVNGKVIERKGPRAPGMIFFNHLGDEMGGLIFGPNGGNGHFGVLTFDKVRNDQAMGFRYLEGDNGTYQSGLEMWQQPNLPSDEMMEKYKAANRIADKTKREAAIQTMVDKNELPADRLFLGKRRDNTMMLAMCDIQGRPRIRMQVSPEGSPKLEFLDEAGKVIYSLGENKPAKK
jgi:hypothetical protein